MSEQDIWDTAAAFIRDFGGDAANEAMNACETTYLAGDEKASDDWLKVVAAIEQLEVDKLSGI